MNPREETTATEYPVPLTKSKARSTSPLPWQTLATTTPESTTKNFVAITTTSPSERQPKQFLPDSKFNEEKPRSYLPFDDRVQIRNYLPSVGQIRSNKLRLKEVDIYETSNSLSPPVAKTNSEKSKLHSFGNTGDFVLLKSNVKNNVEANHASKQSSHDDEISKDFEITSSLRPPVSRTNTESHRFISIGEDADFGNDQTPYPAAPWSSTIAPNFPDDGFNNGFNLDTRLRPPVPRTNTDQLFSQDMEQINGYFANQSPSYPEDNPVITNQKLQNADQNEDLELPGSTVELPRAQTNAVEPRLQGKNIYNDLELISSLSPPVERTNTESARFQNVGLNGDFELISDARPQVSHKPTERSRFRGGSLNDDYELNSGLRPPSPWANTESPRFINILQQDGYVFLINDDFDLISNFRAPAAQTPANRPRFQEVDLISSPITFPTGLR